jgi:hypothetical protein
MEIYRPLGIWLIRFLFSYSSFGDLGDEHMVEHYCRKYSESMRASSARR